MHNDLVRSVEASSSVAKKATLLKARAASVGGSAFNIYDYVNDQAVEVNLKSQSTEMRGGRGLSCQISKIDRTLPWFT